MFMPNRNDPKKMACSHKNVKVGNYSLLHNILDQELIYRKDGHLLLEQPMPPPLVFGPACMYAQALVHWLEHNTSLVY